MVTAAPPLHLPSSPSFSRVVEAARQSSWRPKQAGPKTFFLSRFTPHRVPICQRNSFCPSSCRGGEEGRKSSVEKSDDGSLSLHRREPLIALPVNPAMPLIPHTRFHPRGPGRIFPNSTGVWSPSNDARL